MSLYFFLVVIVSLGCGTLPPMDVAVGRPWLATGMMVIAWTILCHVGVRLIAKQALAGRMEPITAARWMECQLSVFRWIGLPIVLLCLGGFGAARVLDQIPLVADSMGLRAICLLAPGLLMTAATWSAENLYAMLVGLTPRSLIGHLCATGAAVRLGMAWMIAPVLILMFLSDLIHWLTPNEAVGDWLMPVFVIIGIPLGLPWLVRHLFKTEPINGRQRDWIESLLSGVRVDRTRVVRWNTGGATYNAMVAGFVPPLRTLLISDRLLDELPPRQIAMVVLHEAAHLRRRHVPLRMASVLPAWGAGVMLSSLDGRIPYAVAVGTCVGILMTILILRAISYRVEFDADWQACLMAESLGGRVVDVPTDRDAAAESLGEALTRVTSGHPESRRPTWLHPGLNQRIGEMGRRLGRIQETAIGDAATHPV